MLPKQRWLAISLCFVALWQNANFRSHSSQLAHGDGIVTDEPGVFVPVTFDKTQHRAVHRVAEFSNLALAPANIGCAAHSHCKDQLYFFFIRCNEITGKRWGVMNIVGIANFSIFDFDRHPYAVNTLRPPKVTRVPYASVRSHYHTILDRAAETHHAYSEILDRSLWTMQMRLLEDTRDVRIFHLGSSTCVTTVRFKKDVFVVCYDSILDSAKNTSGHNLVITGPSRILEVKRDARNIVPLVHINHQAWTDDLAYIWLFDSMGSKWGTPYIFPVSLINRKSHSPELRTGFNLRGCGNFRGWRGNTPVIRFTDELWITIVHKRVNSLPTLKNLKGRTYLNRIMLMEADSLDGRPIRCANRSYDSDLQSPKPFVYLLGLVHVGVHKNYSGESHTFVTSGSIDDFMPVLHTFNFFLPRAGA
mmetsp:Transcript_7561/g.34257  ORF Transcript_7561/g.34257 Transcript_7561/m.34257 type:complete len:418 (-) Transcript_7561:586-1839(-)